MIPPASTWGVSTRSFPHLATIYTWSGASRTDRRGKCLIPAIGDVVLKIDLEGKTMIVDPPEGLIGSGSYRNAMDEICVLTLFPELFDPFWNHGIIRRAVQGQKSTP